MNYIFKTEDNRSDWIQVRTEVFMKEQGFKEEFDELDKTAFHLTLYTPEGELVGCGRFFEENPGIFKLGRIAVFKKFRGQGAGSAIVRRMESLAKALGAQKCVIGAQVQALNFYCTLGYSKYGEPYLDEHVPHIGMCKAL